MMKGLVGDRPLPTVVVRRRRPKRAGAGLIAADGRLDFLVDDEPLGKRGASCGCASGRATSAASTLALTGGRSRLERDLARRREVGPDGSWEAGSAPTVAVRAGVATIALPAASAARAGDGRAVCAGAGGAFNARRLAAPAAPI